MRLPRIKRFTVLLAVAVPAVITLALFAAVTRPSTSPVYNGRSLEQWRRQSFFSFREAVLALDTNAVPWLISELSASDPVILRWPQRTLERFLSVGEIFTSERARRFDASCVLMSLGTNAIPGLLTAVFSNPPPYNKEFVFQSAEILARSTSPEATALKLAPILAALSDESRRKTALELLYALTVYGDTNTVAIAKNAPTVGDPGSK